MYVTIFQHILLNILRDEKMEIIIHLKCKKIDRDYSLAMQEYIKRTSPFCKVKLINYKNSGKLSLNKSSKKYIVLSGEKTISSPQLSKDISSLNLSGYSCIEYIIGNEFDLPCEGEIINLSSFDMESQLLTVVLTEQLYRAYTILNNITYHK